MSEAEHPGFEIYAGPLELIRRACVENRLSHLRNGAVTKDYVLFPKEFRPAEILYIEDAVATLTGRPVVEIDIYREELDGCLFVDRLYPNWVEHVASLSEDDASNLQQEWTKEYYQAEGEPPEWAAVDHTNLLRQFIKVVRTAFLERKDLVMVWIL